LAEEVLKKIQKAEKEADEIILKANEESKNIAKETDQKIKEDGNKIISDLKTELKQLKEKTVKEANKSVDILLAKEEENIKDILNVDNKKIDEIANILRERVVK
jgi:V-type sodium ATPase, G subunit